MRDKTLHELHANYMRLMEHAAKPRNQQPQEFHDTVKELKRRGIGSLTTLERKMRVQQVAPPAQEKESKSVETGPKGGRYYLSKTGEKVYVK